MGRVENTFNWCLEQGKKKGNEHKGLKKINKDSEESENQMKKAESDLDTMDYLYEGNRTDWVASASFYAMYHALLAVLFKSGYESQNQECTINFIEKLMKDKKISLEKEYINMIRNMQKGIESAKSTREELQYSSKTFMEEERCKKIMENARKFVDRIKGVIEEID